MYWVYTCRIPTTTENSQLRVFELPAPAARSFVSVAHPPCFRHLRRRQTSCLPPALRHSGSGPELPGCSQFCLLTKKRSTLYFGRVSDPSSNHSHSQSPLVRTMVPKPEDPTVKAENNAAMDQLSLLDKEDISSASRSCRELYGRSSSQCRTGLGWTPCKIQSEPTKHVTHSYCIILDAP